MTGRNRLARFPRLPVLEHVGAKGKIMRLEEIKAAVKAGKVVYWSNSLYRVVCDDLGQWLIVCTSNQSTIGLTWQDGVTMNGKPEEFFIFEE